MAGCLSCGVAVYRWGLRSLCLFLALWDVGAWIPSLPSFLGAAIGVRFGAMQCTLFLAGSDWDVGYLIHRGGKLRFCLE